MPRFHFKVFNGSDVADLVGLDLPNLATARVEAIRLAGDMLKEEAAKIAVDTDWGLDVTNEAGLILMRVDVSITESPATIKPPIG